MIQENQKNPETREGSKPGYGFSTVPIWMILLFGALFYWAQLYVSGHAGGFEKDVYTPFHTSAEVAASNPQDENAKFLAIGADVFNKTCSACHQPNGLGKDGVAPPLVGSEWVLAPGPNRIARVVLNGFTGPVTVKGKEWNLNMLAWRDTYDDEHIAAVLSYVRNTWGNKASIVKPAQIALARKDNHPGPMTVPELMQFSP